MGYPLDGKNSRRIRAGEGGRKVKWKDPKRPATVYITKKSAAKSEVKYRGKIYGEALGSRPTAGMRPKKSDSCAVIALALLASPIALMYATYELIF